MDGLPALSADNLLQVIGSISTPLTISDATKPDCPIIYANQSFYDMTYYGREDVFGNNLRFLQGAGTNPLAIEQIRSAIESGSAVKVTLKNYRKDGSPFWNDMTLTPVTDTNGTLTYYVGQQVDVTDRIHQARDFERAHKKMLATLKTARDDFVSVSSHQLRTPATGVKQYLGMVLDGYAGPVSTEMMPYLKTAYGSNERLIEIITSLLKTAQLEIGGDVLHKRAESVADLALEVISDYASIINMRHQAVHFKADYDTTASIDSSEIRIVLSNLLENASRYSPDGQTIEVNVIKKSTRVIVQIKDHGVGIAPADHKKIFEKFVRVNNTLSDTVNGSGLGLYIVRRIIRLHGAKLYVRSSLGKGSTFSVILPV